MQLLFLSCLKATGLIEKKLHFRLSFREKMQLKAHKMMCEACTRYEKQSEFLEKGIQSYQAKLQAGTDIEKLKQDIKISLRHSDH